MARLRDSIRKYRLWLAFVIAFVPLAILMCLQYSWLVKLEDATIIARQTELSNYADVVLKQVAWHYANAAERSLNIDYSLFTQGKLYKAAHYFKKKPVKGIKRIFLMDYASNKEGSLLFYREADHTILWPKKEPEIRSIYVACAPWAVLSHKGTRIQSNEMTVDERDPDNIMVLNPITDETGRLVGVVGMIVDKRFFTEILLPKVVKESMPPFSSDSALKDVVLMVIDPDRKPVFKTGKVTTEEHEVIRWFPWIFTNYRLVLLTGEMNPKQWARSNFAINLSLSGLLVVALSGGILVAFRSASRELKLSEMKTDFVSNVSHELRTPLASIRVFGEFLRLGRPRNPEKVREYGEYIETESRRLTQLINNILDFSKIESGRKTYHFEQADVRDVVDEVLKTFEVRLRHDKCNIGYQRTESDLQPVMMDADAIAQAIHNLLDNAVKYTDPETRQIVVGVEEADTGARIWVKDNGVGISREEQRKIFERFHRVGTGAVHNVRGSGLGLSIVRHVVEAHGGEVTVESDPGRGSRFTIFLPAAERMYDNNEKAGWPGGDTLE